MFTYYARILLRNGSSTRPIYTLMHCKPLHTQMHSKQMRQFSLYDGLYCGYCNNFSTSVHASAIKKPQDEIAAQTAQKKSVRSARDERIVQVFDQNGLFVEKTRLWKAMSDAKKRDLRLVEMKSASGSKKKEKDVDESDLNSYKLVSQNEFSEFLEEKKKEQIKSNSLKQIQMKAKIDQTGLTVKLNQIKELLAKKGKLKILIEDKSRKEVGGIQPGNQQLSILFHETSKDQLSII